MIEPETIAAFNNRNRVNLNNIKGMTPAQRDQVVVWGTNAQNLLSNKDLAQFIHEAKFNVADALSEITTHDADSNNLRIALANQLAGIDSLVALLQSAVFHKGRALGLQDAERNQK